MTTATRPVTFSPLRLDGVGAPVVATGYYLITPTAAYDDGAGRVELIPFQVPVTAMAVTVDLPVTGPGWALKVVGTFPTISGTPLQTAEYVAIPTGTGTLAFENLDRVDPATLTAIATPVPAWWAALDGISTSTNAIVANRPVNLYELGADPAGSVSVTSILNAASGRQVDIPPGTYRVNTAITIPANTTWQAERGVTFLYGGSALSSAMVEASFPNAQVNGSLTLDANHLAFHGLRVSSSNFSSRGLTVQNSNHIGLYVDGGPTAGVTTITDIAFDHLRLYNCGTSANPTSTGMYVRRTRRLKINDAHAEGSYQQGYYIGSYGGGGPFAGSQDCQLTNISAIGNGAIGLDVRHPGATVSNVVAHGNGQAGFALQLEENAGANYQCNQITLSNINCYNNLHPSSGSEGEIMLTYCKGVTAVGLNAYNDLSSGGTHQSLYVNHATDLTVTGSHFIGSGDTGDNVAIVPDCVNVAFVGCSFKALGATPRYNIEATGIDGLRAIGCRFESNGAQNVFLSGAVSNSDFRFGNQWNKALGSRIREYSDITGTGRLPVLTGTPAALTNFTADPTYQGLYLAPDVATAGNQLITDLRNAGYYA